MVTFLEQTAADYVPRFASRTLGMLKEMVRYCARGVADDRQAVRELLRCATLEALLTEARSRMAHLSCEEVDLGPSGVRECSGYASPPAAEAA